MKSSHWVLYVSIAVALIIEPSMAFSHTVVAPDATRASIDTAERPRVTLVVDNNAVSVVPKSHLALVDKLTPMADVDVAMPMNHLQMVLRRSARRTSALNELIADQHNPDSSRFHQWLTPEQFGHAFGLTDPDIQATTAWLVSQGFKVNGVYPNHMQIDFSGTAGQVNQSFHTQVRTYRLADGSMHIAIANDISIPTALQPIVAGVTGLTNLLSKPMQLMPTLAERGEIPLKPTSASVMQPETLPAVNPRNLVPYDLAKMYDIAPLRANGVTGKGVTIAVVSNTFVESVDWTAFVNTFQLAGYGGSFSEIAPQSAGMSNCVDPLPAPNTTPAPQGDRVLTADAEWASAIAPGANIEVASCEDSSSTDVYSGVITAATNLINSATRPDIIDVGGFTFSGEYHMDSATKTAIDLAWEQADAEGISVFVGAGDSGTGDPLSSSAPVTNYSSLYFYSVDVDHGVDANAFATSPHVTAVGGTDTADVLDRTTSRYFSSTPNAVDGTALSYVPEIPYNLSCGNGVAAVSRGWSGAVALCQAQVRANPGSAYTFSNQATGGAPSTVNSKPAWQGKVTGVAADQSRDVPDVSLFGGSYHYYTSLVSCWSTVSGEYPFPCQLNDLYGMPAVYGTSLSAAMFAGVQAVINQGLAARGLPLDQGNAAPTLYALAALEYGTGSGVAPPTLAACNSNNGASGTANCVFHNITRGSNSVNCAVLTVAEGGTGTTPNCYIYTTLQVAGPAAVPIGLTAINTTEYNPQTKAYGAQPGWSFTSGLGSVDVKNLLIAWRAFDHASPASTQ